MNRRDTYRQIRRLIKEALVHLAECQRLVDSMGPTLLEWASDTRPSPSAEAICELLNQSNDIMQHILWSDG